MVGWDGYLYPYAFNISDFEPIVKRTHAPPPVHQTFEGPNFVICSFCPRPFDFDPEAVPIPYNHHNVDSDEMMYYVAGDYSARKGSGVGLGSITLHPSGFTHGPQPGAVEAVIAGLAEGKTSTDETAVMIDTFRPLQLATAARRPRTRVRVELGERRAGQHRRPARRTRASAAAARHAVARACRSEHDLAARDVERRAGDPGRCVRGQEERGRGDVLGLADPPQREARAELGPLLRGHPCRILSFSTADGARQLTRMPRRAYSPARCRVNATTRPWRRRTRPPTAPPAGPRPTPS